MTNQRDHDTLLKEITDWDAHIQAFVDLGGASKDPQNTTSGPLSGLTFGIKDIIDVAGLPTRNGSDACHGAKLAKDDAPVVAALRSAGAHIIGKTTTTEFAFTDPTGCRNPHDLNRTPGGSSSGSGAAVAAGIVDVALGTQTAGSLCRPAAYCGVVGFKPSYGVLPNIGVTPLAPSFDSVGIIARTVALAVQAFGAMAPSESVASLFDQPKFVSGLWKGDVTPQEDTLTALNDATQVFGMDSQHSSLPADVDRIVAAHRIVMHYEAADCHGAMLSDARGNQLKPKFLAALRAGALITPAEAQNAADFLTQAKHEFWQRHADVDAILTLPVPDGPPFIDGTTGFQDWLTPWTVFGGPLVCLPWGTDRLGRPRSVMLAAHPGKDAALLDIAAALERLSPPLPRPKLPNF